MDNKLDTCLEKFTNLRPSSDRNRWGKNTNFRYPGKPLLLLSVIDLAAVNALRENVVEPSFELAGLYNRYWQTVSPSPADLSLAETFMELEQDGFWKMTGPKDTAAPQAPIDSMGELSKSYLGAAISPEISPLLTEKQSRKIMREALISTYFSSEMHACLLDVALINHAAAIYREELLSETSAVPAIKTGRGETINRRISALGFASAILDLYDHRCAICGIKLMTPEGHSAVEAKRLMPREAGGNDHPSNGVAMCRICGWSFDHGLIGIGEEYQVLIPIAVRLNGNLPGHILIFKGRTISKPKRESFHPSQENLAWHRQNLLRD